MNAKTNLSLFSSVLYYYLFIYVIQKKLYNFPRKSEKKKIIYI